MWDPTAVSHSELIIKAREVRTIEYDKLSAMSFETLGSATLQSLETISELSAVTDPQKIFKTASLVYTLIKLRNDHYSKLIQVLNQLRYGRFEELGIFVSFVYAKLLKRTRRGYTQAKLDNCLLQLKSSKRVLQAAYFLYFLAKYSPNSILLCISQFINATMKAILHQREDARIIGYQALKLYLQALDRGRLSDSPSNHQSFNLYLFAQQNLGKKPCYEQHGAFLIFSALIEFSPQSIGTQAQELMEFFTQSLSTGPVEMRRLAQQNLVLLSTLERQCFVDKYLERVTDVLLRDNSEATANEMSSNSLLRLIRNFPTCVGSEQSDRIINVMRSLLTNCTGAPIPNAYLILDELFPALHDKIEELCTILRQTRIDANYIRHVPRLFQKSEIMWQQYLPRFERVLVTKLPQTKTVEFLELMAKCPSLESSEVNTILSDLLNSSDIRIRGAVPQALMAQSFTDGKTYEQILYKLATIALSDSSSEVRAKILRSFPPKSFKFLAVEPILSSFAALVKDEHVDVSNAAIALVGNLAELNPFDVTPVLRRVLLDDLFLLDSPRPLRIKEEMTRSFLTVISATFGMLSTYSPTLCDICLRQLSFTPSRELTYFEESFIININLNITRAIKYIAKRDVSLIRPYIPQFVNFFFWLLQQHGPKKLKIVLVKTLYIMMSGANNIVEIDVKEIFQALKAIASKWNSRKLNVAVLKLMGFIGAIDHTVSDNVELVMTEDPLDYRNPSYFSSTACKTLLSVLSDDSLVIHHAQAVKALCHIFCHDPRANVEYFYEFVPLFIEQILKNKQAVNLVLLRDVCAKAPKTWVKHFSSELVDLVQQLWSTSLAPQIVDLIPVLAIVLADKLSSFIPDCITFLLDQLYESRESNYKLAHKILVAIVSLKGIACDYLFLVYPEIIECMMSATTHQDIIYDCLVCLRIFVQTEDVGNFAPQIMRCALRMLETNNAKHRAEALEVLYSLIANLGDLFAFCNDQVTSTLKRIGVSTSKCTEIFNKKDRKLSDFPFIKTDDPFTVTLENNTKDEHIPMDAAVIREKIDFREDETPWNWKEWYHAMVVVSIEQSPNLALRSCSFLSASSFNIIESIWHVAFFSIWLQMKQEQQLFVSAILTRALLSPALPGAISSSLVGLLYFMERTEHRIQISKQVLCQTCIKCSQFAKCCYFVNRWYEEDPHNVETIETMIKIFNELHATKTIQGISNHLMLNPGLSGSCTWCEQLGQWSMALEGYRKMEKTPSSLHGILRCLKHLQYWDEIIDMMPECEPLLSSYSKGGDMATIIATALFNRQQWTKLPAILDYCSDNSERVLLIKALYQISQNNQEEALKTVANGFDVLANSARNVFKHDESALYNLLVKAQQLYEISEIAEGTTDLDIWSTRFAHCRQSFDVYHQIMSVRLTVFKVDQMMKDVLRMVKFALKSQDFLLFDSSLNFLFPDSSKWPIEVSFLHARCTWSRGRHNDAMLEMQRILSNLKTAADKNLCAKILFTYGQWIILMAQPDQLIPAIEKSVPYLEQSIAQGTHYFHAWHRWAWACSVMFSHDKSKTGYAFNGINGFLECVRLRTATMSELLQMISLFFGANLDEETFAKAAQRVSNLSDGVLLKILPQLFTRLSRDGTQISDFVANVIRRLLEKHHHVLLYPLLLLVRSGSEAAKELFDEFSELNELASEQASILSDGLVDCSISLLEKLVDVMVEATKRLQQHDIAGVHELIARGLALPRNHGDADAAETYKELSALLPLITKREPNAVMSEIRRIHMKAKSLLSSTHALALHTTAPSLAQLRNSVLAVPGTYSISSPVKNISFVDPSLVIFNSKQRPRLVKIYSTDGNMYRSLLKGREDLRLDQRVMSFFRLINQHTAHDLPNDAANMRISTYEITPLSKTSGLIEFVNGTDTMFSLISDYRTQRNREVFEEKHIMEDLCGSHSNTLMRIQRLEGLKAAAAETIDTDLREVIWLTSPSATEWINRSSRFTQTAAQMSIVGYVIGLGDRHPSNLMVHRYTGTVIHIDLSDCFEISRNRVRFAEFVPFRLTRMMKRAFGPIGIEGEFRITCENAAALIRSHQRSVTAVLDIFLQEPLTWANKDESVNIGDAMNRVMEKIAGKDFGEQEMSVTDQVAALIDSATDMYNFANMYQGWTPLW